MQLNGLPLDYLKNNVTVAVTWRTFFLCVLYYFRLEFWNIGMGVINLICSSETDVYDRRIASFQFHV